MVNPTSIKVMNSALVRGYKPRMRLNPQSNSKEGRNRCGSLLPALVHNFVIKIDAANAAGSNYLI